MSKTPRHAKPKEEAEQAKTLSWLAFLKKADPPPPEITDCIICQTYRERKLLPPQGHVCMPIGLADVSPIKVIQE